jgi:hypothetical protein
MHATAPSPLSLLPDVVLDLVPRAHASPTPACRRAAMHDGLATVASALGGDSFALLQFDARGAFQSRLSVGYGARALSGRSVVDGHLLLRRLAASRDPISLHRDHVGPTGATLDGLGIAWVVGIPARTSTRSRGVFVVTGLGDAPHRAQLRPLVALSGPLAMALGAPAHDPMPAIDPTVALRSASRRSPWVAMWSRWSRALHGST